MLVLDPGHGGTDPGAVAPDGTEEYLINQKIVHRTRALTTFFMPSIQTCEYTDSLETSLAARAELALNIGDVFVSVHCNSVTNPAAHGLEIYYYPGSTKGELMALKTYQDIMRFARAAGYEYIGRGIKPACFQVLRDTKCPAILIECGFISNPAEFTWLNSEKGQIVIASAITYSLIA